MDAVTLALIKSMAGNGGGGSLPAVTSADNGKVLMVDNGAWAADSNLFLVTATSSASDKSRSEILDAIEEGRSVVLIKGTLRYFPSGQDNSFVYFINETKIANDRYINVISVSEDKSVSVDKIYMLPNPSSSDNGKELVIKNSSVVYQAKKFIVTLTPTAPDYSGTMDKTVAQINEAYEAGQEIVFKVLLSATQWVEVPVQARYDATYSRYAFNTYVIDSGNNILLLAYTQIVDGSSSTYSTTVYSLTPAS